MSNNAVDISIIESLIFAADEPLRAQEIIRIIKAIDGEDQKISENNIDEAVESLNTIYIEQGRPFNIRRISEGYVYATNPKFAKYVGFLSAEKSKRRLSQAALETLAIVAYKQPVTKPDIEAIRGVNSDAILSTLLEKNLITISGRAETIGRPLIFSTTEEFLKYFALNKISDLPKPREVEEIMQDEEFLEQKRKIMMNQLEEMIENEETQVPEQDENQ